MNTSSKQQETKWLQKIYFGPPGCGKSFRVRQETEDLDVVKAGEDPKKSPNMIETTFHPEYCYGDFVAKLLPKTENRRIKYCIHAGPLVKALARAYVDSEQQVLLVIDEINRGNCAQIFGDIFQLLDRNEDGWSEYGIDSSDLVMDALKQELDKHEKTREPLPEELKAEDGKIRKLRLPPNLSIIGTMNTSDESVYYMDTAFKRRWDFEFISWQGESVPEWQTKALVGKGGPAWHEFLERLNDFIAHEFKGRNVDDKQVGIWFLKTSNLPKFKEEKERQGVVLSVRQVELLKKLRRLYEKATWREWKKIVPESKKVTEWGNEKIPDAEQLKLILTEHYAINCTDLNLGSKAEFFAKNITDYIFDKNPTTQHIVDVKREEVSSGSIPEIESSAIKNKLMFFLWDNVFSRNKKPLHELLKTGDAKNKGLANAEASTIEMPRTFGDFASAENVTAFIEGVMAWSLVGK